MSENLENMYASEITYMNSGASPCVHVLSPMSSSTLRKGMVELQKIHRQAYKEIKMMEQLPDEERVERLRLLGLGTKTVG